MLLRDTQNTFTQKIIEQVLINFQFHHKELIKISRLPGAHNPCSYTISKIVSFYSKTSSTEKKTDGGKSLVA